MLQLPASALSSSCSLLPSWRHQWFHRCWDVICLPIFSALNANLQHGCWCVAPQSWSSLWLAARRMYDKKAFDSIIMIDDSLWLAARRMYDKKAFDSMRTLWWHELISRKFEFISGELILWELISRDDPGNTYPSPPFVGNDYFCESTCTKSNWGGSHQNRFYPDALLWDGQVCEGGGRCCRFNNPPWFTKKLTSPTIDSIELRLCLYESNYWSDIALKLLELYVQ